TPPWARTAAATPKAAPAVVSGPVAELLAGHPAACDAVAGLLGCEGGWRQAASAAGPGNRAVETLLTAHPATTTALATLLT
ncbi:hypothetical protein, partial [Nonomuraea sp. NPDC001023]